MSDSFATPGTVALQAPLSIGFPRQEYWSGLPFSSLGDLTDPRIKLQSPALAEGFLTHEPPGKPINLYTATIINFPNYHFDYSVPQYFTVSNAALLFHGPINEGTHSPIQWDAMGLLNVHVPFQPLTVCRYHALLAIPHSITACPRVEAHVGMLPRLVL